MNKQEFLDTIPEDNTQWVAQQLVSHFSYKELSDAATLFERMKPILYKSWVEDMTLKEIRNAIFKAEEIVFHA